MELELVEISNYRSIKTLTLPLERFTTIVGQNNAGKSNILRAVQWLIRPWALMEKDFNNETEDIVVFGRVSGLDKTVLDLLNPDHRKTIEPLIGDESILLKRVMDHNNLSKKGITLYVSSDVNGDFQSASWKKNPTGIDQAIQALFPDVIEVPAMSNSFEDATKYTAKTTMAQLVAQIIGAFKSSHESTIEKSLNNIRDLVSIDGGSRATELNSIDQLVSGNLSDIFPGIDVKLHIDLPTVDDIFKGALFKTIENGIPRDIDFLGHGTQRSIQMSLIRSLSQLVSASTVGSTVLLVVEEPELYLHPYAIELTRSALKLLSESNFQVLIVTHSPMMIAQEDVATAVMVRANQARGTFRLNTISERIKRHIVEKPSQAEVMFSLSNKAGILFSDKILLVEGRTELRLLPAIFKKIVGATMLARSIALVPQDGVENTVICLRIVNDLGQKGMAIADLDFAFRGAVRGGLIVATEPAMVELKKLLVAEAASQKFGLDQEGLPTKGNGFKAIDGYRFLAKNAAATKHISTIHTILLQKGVWIWTRGSIEDHLGLSDKNEAAWSRFLAQLSSNGLSSLVPTPDDFKNLAAWLEQ